MVYTLYATIVSRNHSHILGANKSDSKKFHFVLGVFLDFLGLSWTASSKHLLMLARLYDVIEPVVRQVWVTVEQPCGKRLAPILRLWLSYYERHYGGRQRGPLWGQFGRGFHLERDLHRYSQWLDRRRSRVE